MKLGIFADPHYCKADLMCKTRRPALSLGKMKEALKAFCEAKVDLCICMGDLIDMGDIPEDPKERIAEAMAVIYESKLPFRILQGNHDCALFSAREFAERTNCPMLPCALETNTHTLIFLDANFRSNYGHYYEEGMDWKDSNLPPGQIEFLKNTLATSKKPCIVLLHENLDPNVQINHIVKNAAEARGIIENSGKVSLVIQGHYHKGADNIVNRIRYLTVPAMCEGEENRYIILDL